MLEIKVRNKGSRCRHRTNYIIKQTTRCKCANNNITYQSYSAIAVPILLNMAICSIVISLLFLRKST